MRFVAIGLGLVLAGCASEQVTGNSTGGIIPWFLTNEASAFKAADGHCRQFGREAKITQIVPYAGGSVTFECVRP